MKKEKGFTLIELLVVIAIIALLLAILIPSLKSARNSAKVVVCQSHLKQWGTIVAIYTYEHNGHLPNYGLLIENYKVFDDRRILFCPMALKKSKGGFLGSTFEAWGFDDGFKGSYGSNHTLNGIFSDSDVHLAWKEANNIYNLKQCYNIPLMLDSANNTGYIIDGMGPPLDEFDEHERALINSFCINRHQGCVNSLFLDWSVRKVGLKELWKLKWQKDFDTNGPWTMAGGVKPEDWPKWMRGFKDY